MTRNEILRRFPNATESFIRGNLDCKDSSIRAAAELERAAEQKSLDADQKKEANPKKYYIRVIAFQARMHDWDNPVAKWHVDALRYIGLIPDDDPSICDGKVERVRIKHRIAQKTIIEIYEV